MKNSAARVIDIQGYVVSNALVTAPKKGRISSKNPELDAELQYHLESTGQLTKIDAIGVAVGHHWYNLCQKKWFQITAGIGLILAAGLVGGMEMGG